MAANPRFEEDSRMANRAYRGVRGPRRKRRTLEQEWRHNRREIDRLIFHGGSTAATTNALDRRYAADRKMLQELAAQEQH
jgi:hypothetical protein